jgi:A/G-specific adenine glycosylase
LICTPRNPRCAGCPLRKVCKAGASGHPERFPVRKPKPATPLVKVGAAVTLDGLGRILIARRKEKGLLGGLWEFPGGKIHEGETFAECVRRELAEELGIGVEVGPELLLVRHVYSHFKLEMHVHAAIHRSGVPRAIDCADFRWVTVPEMRSLPFSRADIRVIEWLESHALPPVAP